MFIRIAALLTLLLVSANAYTLDTTSTTVYKKDFGIFVYGDIESIENAFVLVQAISTSSQLQTIIQLFMLFFLPYTAFKMVKTGTFKPLFANLTYVTASILTMSTATVPSCSIHIEDLRLETRIASLGLPSTTYAKVDNIPYPIALVTSTVSTITDSLTILYEDAIALLKPDLEGASSKAVGSGNAINDIMKILQTTAFNKLNDAESNLFVRSLSAYVSECGLKLATSKDPDLVINFTNPNKDLFKAIDPGTLNITGSTYTLTFTDGVNGEKTYQCDEFWNNNIISKYDVIASKLQERVAKVLTGDITSSNVVTSYLTMAGSINDTVIAGNIGQMKATFMNLAAMSPISKAFANTSIDMSSGQDLANRITAGTSLAELEMNGAGQMRWVSEVLPYAYHYMLGIIYSISILIMIVATAMGYEKGFGVWKNFVKGLTTYELTKVSLVIVNSSVNQYTAKHAADFIASVGQNPVTISSIPYYYHYMATMAGIAGILGAIAVLSIPAMVFSGEVSTALGALGAITGRYKGNDVNTATEVTAEQKAKQEAYERELQDQAMLDRLGVSVPAGMGASEFYGLYKRGAEAMNANLGAQRLGTNAMADAGVAVKGQTIQGIAAGQALAGNTSMSEFALSGTSGGLRHSGGIKGEGNALVDFGGDAIALSAELGAYTQGAEGVKMTEGRVNAGLANSSDGRLTSKALKSMSRRAGFDSANLAAMADAKYTDKNGNALSDEEAFALRAKAAAGQSAEMPIKDAAYIKTAMNSDGGLNHKYASGLGTSEEAKFASVKGVGALSTSEQERYVKASENASTIKAAQTIGDTEGQMKQYGDEAKKAGKELADVIRDVANTVAQGKTGSTIGAINEVGSDAYIKNQITKAQSDVASLNSAISASGGARDYIAMNATMAAIGASQTKTDINTMKTLENKDGQTILDSNGNLTTFGQETLSVSSAEKYGASSAKTTAFGNINREKLLRESASALSKKEKISKEEALKKVDSALNDMGFKDDSSASGVAGAFAAMGATNFASSRSLNIAGMNVQMGVDASGNSRTFIDGKTGFDVGHNQLSQNITKSGEVIDSGQGVAAAAFAYNIANPNHKVKMNQDGTIDYKNTSKENLAHFMQNIQNKDFTEESKRALIGELVAGISDATGLNPEEAMALGGATVVGLFAGKPLWNSMKPKDSMPNKASNNNGNSHPNGAKDESHGSSFHDNIKNYTEEYGASKELFDKESRNLDNLKSQREHLDEMDPRQASRAHKLDEQILESEKKLAGHKHDMEIADRNVKATKHLSTKHEPEGHTSNMSGVKKGLIGAFAMSAVNNMFEEFGINSSNNQALLTINEASNFTDDILGAGIDLIGGTTKAGLRLFTGGDSWGALKGGISTAASKVADSYNNNMTNNDERFKALQAQHTIDAAQNDSGLAPAIDSYNASQNSLAMQQVQPNRVTTMQTRGGEMSFVRNSKSGNLDVHLPGQTFAENTGVPFSQFEAMASDPSQAQQFAQMIAKSNFEGQGGGGVASAQDIEQLKTEINSNFNKSFVQNRNLSSNSSMTAMEIENQTAMQNDAGLPTAIDAFHTNQNMNTLQAVQPNTISTMQTRGGEMSFMRNSKSGNLDVHLPSQPFAENTNIPFGQFQDIASNPQMAQQFAQMVAKSNFDGQSGDGIATATDMVQLKNEIDRNFQQNSIQTMNLRTSASMTAMELENTNEIIEEQVSTSIASVQDTLDDMKRQLER